VVLSEQVACSSWCVAGWVKEEQVTVTPFSCRQVEDASEIASIAQQAYNISSDAYEMARQALEQQHYTANQIRVLEVQVPML